MAYDGAKGMRRRDANFNPAHRRMRLVAEQDGVVVAWGQVGNMWSAYNPRTFQMRLEVEPGAPGPRHWCAGVREVGGDRRCLGPDPCSRRSRRAVPARHRVPGTACVRRDPTPLGIAAARRRSRPGGVMPPPRRGCRSQGLVVTTYAQELGRRGDRLARDLFDMELRAATKEPGYEAGTSMSFDQFRAIELETENAIPEANFLALDGERLVGVSRVGRRTTEPRVLNQDSPAPIPTIRAAALPWRSSCARSTTPRRTASARSGPRTTRPMCRCCASTSDWASSANRPSSSTNARSAGVPSLA